MLLTSYSYTTATAGKGDWYGVVLYLMSMLWDSYWSLSYIPSVWMDSLWMAEINGLDF